MKTYLFVMDWTSPAGAWGSANVDVSIPDGKVTLAEIRDVERSCRERGGWRTCVVTNVIPLDGP